MTDEVLSAIRKHATLSSTPVIILSVEDTVLYDFAAESADMVLLKPVDPDDLLTLVERLLGSSAHNA
jgi:DNA-binding response OmpR family regulator